MELISIKLLFNLASHSLALAIKIIVCYKTNGKLDKIRRQKESGEYRVKRRRNCPYKHMRSQF